MDLTRTAGGSSGGAGTAVDDAARLCDSLGHDVEEAEPGPRFARFPDFDRPAHAMSKVYMGTQTAATVNR